MTSPALQVANTIKKQIGWNTLACIGANNFYFFNSTDKHAGGLAFKFSPCPKVRGGGHVRITLNFNDTYTVTIMNNRGRCLKEIEGVYCDMLSGPSGVIEQVTG